MPSTRNKDNGIPLNPIAGRPNLPAAKVLATGATPTFVVPPSKTQPGEGGGGIPLSMEYLEDGSVPIFWGDNQFMRQTDQRYYPPSGTFSGRAGMIDNSTLSIPEVVRFLYSGLPGPNGCLPPTTSPPPPPPPPPPPGTPGELVVYMAAAGPSIPYYSYVSDSTKYLSVPVSSIPGADGSISGSTPTETDYTYTFDYLLTAGVYDWSGINPVTATCILYFGVEPNLNPTADPVVMSITAPLAYFLWIPAFSGPYPTALGTHNLPPGYSIRFGSSVTILNIGMNYATYVELVKETWGYP